MAEVRLEREFLAEIETVFAFVTQKNNLVKWWGPEGVHIPRGALDFQKLGQWDSVMCNDEGREHHVSGQVTHVDPPHSVGFTWAWHDEDGKRGEESHVTMTLTALQDGKTRFVLHHQQLADADAAANHEFGWTSSMRKLGNLI